MASRNSENTSPNTVRADNEGVAKPNDDDRARFGFGYKKSGTTNLTKSVTSLLAVSEGQLQKEVALEAPPKSAPAKDVPSISRKPPALQLLKDMDEILGNPDDLKVLLKLQPTSSKYELKDRSKETEEINKTLKDRIFDLGGRWKKLYSHFASTEDEVNQRLTVAEGKVQEQKRSLEELQTSLSSTQKDLKEKIGQLEKANTKNMSLVSKGEQSASRASTAEASLRECKAEVESLKKEVSDANQQTKAHEKTASEWAQKAQQQFVENAEKQQTLLSLASKKEEELMAEIDRKSSCVSELEARAVSAENDLQQKTQAFEASARQCTVLSDTNTEQVTTINQLKARLEEQEGQLAKLHDSERQLKETLRISECSTEDMCAKLESSQKKVTELQLTIQCVESENGRFASVAQEAQKALGAHQEEHVRLQTKLGTLEAQVGNQEATLTQKEEELQNLRKDEQGVREELQASTREAAALKADLLQCNDARKREVDGLRDELTSCKDIREKLEGKLQSAENDRDRFSEDAAAKQRDLQESQKDLAHLRTSLESSLEAKDKELTSVRSENATFQQKIAKLEAQCNSDAESLQSQKQEIAGLTSKLKGAEQDLVAVQKQLTAAQEEGQALEARCEAEKAASQISAQELDKCQLQLSEQKQREEELCQRMQSLESVVADGLKELQSQKEDNGRLSAAVEETKKSLTQAQLDLKAAQDKSTNLTQDKEKLEVAYQCYKEHHGTNNSEQMMAISELQHSVDQLTKKVESAELESLAQKVNVEKQQALSCNLEQQLSEALRRGRELHNVIQELKGNIRVFCRVRPVAEGAERSLESPEENKLQLWHGPENYNFSFDKVFTPASMQEEVFDELSGLVQSALDGYKVCIFAYGQTGSGKTFTMQGTSEPRSWGIIPRSLDKIFRTSEQMRAQGWAWSLQASFIEVYNESLRDLLSDDEGGDSKSVHVIQHHDEFGTMVTNMTSIEVNSMAQIKSLMAKAAKHRAVGSTDMNAVSSRSHSVFALYLKGTNAGLGSELNGALHLVDLAGSERLDKSHAVGDRLKETQNINRSLSSLADVFLAKAENRPHVPFRNSKLTHLMEPCLSGQGKTMMVVNVGPEQTNAHETLCSLRFASQVSQCDTGGKPKRTCKSINSGNSVSSSSSRPHTPAPGGRSQNTTGTSSTTGAYAGQRSPPGSAPGSRSPPNAAPGAQGRQRPPSGSRQTHCW